MAIELSGTGQYLTAATGFGLGANSAVWLVFRAWMDVTTTQVAISIGVAGSANNKRHLLYTASGFQAQAINNTGTSASSGTSAATSGAWHTVVAEWGSSTSRAITVDNGSRLTNATSNGLTLAPDQMRVGASHTASALLDGRLAWIGIWSGAPTAAARAALFAGAHPRLVSPSTLLEAWDFANTSNLTGWRGTVLTATGSPTTVDSPPIYQPRGRSLVPVPVTARPPLATDVGSYVLTGSSAGLVYGGGVATPLVTQYRSVHRGVFPRVPGRVN